MAFTDKFVECMQGSGISIGDGVVSDPSTFKDAVDYVKQWYDSVDSTTKQALDDASQYAEQVAYHLVDANIAPSLPDLMRAFDDTSGMPLSTFLDWCVYCAEQAASEEN